MAKPVKKRAGSKAGAKRKAHEARQRPAPKAAPAKPEQKPPVRIKKIFRRHQLKEFRQLLMGLRDRVVDEITFLAGDNLNRSQRDASGDLSSYSFHMADQGTDNFDREFALNLVSSEQDVLYEIDEALARMDLGTYGVCEACGKPIERARLNALPFARMCVRCKSEQEKGKTRFRPFGPTISQAVEPS